MINSKEELLKYCVNPPPPYTPYEWAKVYCVDTNVYHKLNQIDFSKSSLILGCISADRYLAGYKQRLYQLGKSTYYHKLHVDFPSSFDYGTRILYYSVIIDKIPNTTTIIHDVVE